MTDEQQLWWAISRKENGSSEKEWCTGWKNTNGTLLLFFDRSKKTPILFTKKSAWWHVYRFLREQKISEKDKNCYKYSVECVKRKEQ